MNTRTYTRPDGDHEQTVYLHIDNSGYIRMKADNMDEVLTHLGFVAVNGR